MKHCIVLHDLAPSLRVEIVLGIVVTFFLGCAKYNCTDPDRFLEVVSIEPVSRPAVVNAAVDF